MSARIGLLSSLLLSALTPSAMAALEKVKVCVPAFREEFLTVSILEGLDKGIFQKHGLELELVSVRHDQRPGDVSSKAGVIPGPAVLDQGSSAQVGAKDGCQFGTSIIEAFIFDEKNRENVKPLYVSMYGQNYDTHLVVPKDSPIRSVKDLKGKKIRLGQLPTHLALHNILKEEGLSLADVKPEWRVEPTAVLAMFDRGELDAAITYVPSMAYMLASGKVRILKENIVKKYVRPSVPHSLLVANRDFAQRSPKTVQKFLAAVGEAKSQIERNPSEVIYTLQRNNTKIAFSEWKTDRVIAERAAAFVGAVNGVSMLTDTPARAAVTRAVADYADLIYRMEYIPAKVDLSAWLGEGSLAQKVGSL